jgi:hypothetical protein
MQGPSASTLPVLGSFTWSRRERRGGTGGGRRGDWLPAARALLYIRIVALGVRTIVPDGGRRCASARSRDLRLTESFAAGP